MSDSSTAQANLLSIEVIYALPDEQNVIFVSLPAGSTVHDAVTHSGLLDNHWPNDNLKIIPGETPVGIFGERVSYDEPLEDGDRVEIYRPLVVDPMEARRARAHSQKQQQTQRD